MYDKSTFSKTTYMNASKKGLSVHAVCHVNCIILFKRCFISVYTRITV